MADEVDAVSGGDAPDPVAQELASSPTAQGGGPTPDAPTVAAAGGTAPQPTDSGGVKLGVEYKGSTEHGKKYAAGLFGQADKANDQFADEDAKRAEAEQEQSREHFGDLRIAQHGEEMVTRDYMNQAADLDKKVSDFYDTAAKTQLRMMDEAKAERQKYLTAYQEQLAGVRALAAQSGNPYNRMTAGEKLGLAGAQFAQGFLAARGINIDVNGQIDRWVDRSIKEHQQAVENARGAANDQFHLYEIARQNSQDDWEAQQRYRGFVIQGLQTQIQSNATRFQSQLAIAHSQEQSARLQIEADATARSIADHHQDRVEKRMQLDYDRAYKQGMLGVERVKAQADILRAQASKAKTPAANLNIADPEFARDANGKEILVNGQRVQINRWRVDPTQPPEVQAKVREEAGQAYGAYSKYKDSLDQMMKTYPDAKKIYDSVPSYIRDAGWDMVARYDKTGKVAQFLQDRNQMVLQKIYNDSGKQINENEFQRQEALAYLDKVFAHNGEKAERSYAELRESGRKIFERNMQMPGLKSIAPNDPERQQVFEGSSPHMKAEDSAVLSDQPPVKTVSDLAVPEESSFETGNLQPSSRAFKKLMGTDAEIPSAHAVELLARTALDPATARRAKSDPVFKGMDIPDDDATLSREAIEGLQRLTQSPDPRTGAYASKVLDELNTNPDEMYRLLGGHIAEYKPERLPTKKK